MIRGLESALAGTPEVGRIGLRTCAILACPTVLSARWSYLSCRFRSVSTILKFTCMPAERLRQLRKRCPARFFKPRLQAIAFGHRRQSRRDRCAGLAARTFGWFGRRFYLFGLCHADLHLVRGGRSRSPYCLEPGTAGIADQQTASACQQYRSGARRSPVERTSRWSGKRKRPSKGKADTKSAMPIQHFSI